MDALAPGDLEEKMAAGVFPVLLLDHPFINETIRLKVTVADASKRDALAAGVTSQLAARNVPDLEKIENGSVEVHNMFPERFFISGRGGINHESSQHQLLVRATPDEIDDLLRIVGNSVDRPKDIRLAAGPVKVEGLEQSRNLFKMLAGESKAGDGASAKKPSAAAPMQKRAGFADGRANRESADTQFVDDLLRSVGVDPQLLTAGSERSSSGAAVEGAGGRRPEMLPEESAQSVGTLVERRTLALRRANKKSADFSTHRAHSSEAASGRASGAVANAELSVEPPSSTTSQAKPRKYVTFVIEFVVAEPDRHRKPASARKRPPPKSKKSSKNTGSNDPAG